MAEIRPLDYGKWRGHTLGAITESLEQELVFELAGGLHGCRMLDLGTGDGSYAIAAARRGAQVTAIDQAPDMLAAARRRAADAAVKVDWRCGDARRLPFAEQSFDLVLAVTVLCFISDADRAVREMARVLAPSGRLVLGELGSFSIWAMWRRMRGCLGVRLWRDAVFRSPADLRALATSANLTVTSIRGAVYYPPVGLLARIGAPLDRQISSVTLLGAAFLAMVAQRAAAGADGS
jgi:SAM-dependent methyltransferase